MFNKIKKDLKKDLLNRSNEINKDLEERKNNFTVEYQTISNKYQIGIRPILDKYGPSFELADLKKYEESKQSEDTSSLPSSDEKHSEEKE